MISIHPFHYPILEHPSDPCEKSKFWLILGVKRPKLLENEIATPLHKKKYFLTKRQILFAMDRANFAYRNSKFSNLFWLFSYLNPKWNDGTPLFIYWLLEYEIQSDSIYPKKEKSPVVKAKAVTKSAKTKKGKKANEVNN